MAVITCKECGNVSSAKAKTCRHCGAKARPSVITGTWNVQEKYIAIAIGAVLIAYICMFVGSTQKTPVVYTQETPVVYKSSVDPRKVKIDASFSAWDGSHYGLTRIIKNGMNDPKSYKHAETIYIDKGDYLKVKTVFRGKNAFGGVVKNWVWAKVDLDGNVIEVIAQGS